LLAGSTSKQQIKHWKMQKGDNRMIYLATNKGVVSADPARGWQITGTSLEGLEVTTVTAREGALLAGTTDGIYRTDNSGREWREVSSGLTQRHIRWLAFSPDNKGTALAGTEPASIFITSDGGENWRECSEVAQLRDRFQWFLPYSPEAGCVRGFAFQGSRVYAAVEVGGVLRSDDGGATWKLAEGSDGRPDTQRAVEPLIHADVHSIETHPSSPDLVYAPTGGGFFRSLDGGKTWQKHYDCYARAVWVDPTDTEHILLGPADRVDRNGRIEESRDGGKTWMPGSEGLAVPWSSHMVERFTSTGEDFVAVLSNGEVLVRPLQGGAWQRVLETVKGVQDAVIQ
jgi:photosystem II stability/assembly factor-like uncharacterized protein